MVELRWKQLWTKRERQEHGSAPRLEADDATYVLQYRVKRTLIDSDDYRYEDFSDWIDVKADDE
jgi:hypothetical protein